MIKTNHARTAAMAVGVAALGAMCIFAPDARSADHRDGVAAEADPAGDINDVYSFMDGTNFVAAMTVFPFASATATDAGPAAAFSNAVQYVFHTTSAAAYGLAGTMPVDIICTFKSDTSIQCWVGDDEYVTGDPSTMASSADGKVKVFAGLRADPFHFDLCGFRDVESAVIAAAPSLTFDPSGCPALDAKTAGSLVKTLAETKSKNTTAPCPGKSVADDFATANTLALVVTVDASLVTKAGPIVGIWGATYQAM